MSSASYRPLTLPCHPSLCVPDLGIVDAEPFLPAGFDATSATHIPRWSLVRALLSTPIHDAHALLSTIDTLLVYDGARVRNTDMLELFFTSSKNEAVVTHFFAHVLPWLQRTVLALPELFPTGELGVLAPMASPADEAVTEQAVVLTRAQCTALLGCMFFIGTMVAPRWCQFWADFRIFAGANFVEWPVTPSVLAYWRTLIEYFTQEHQATHALAPHACDTTPVSFIRRAANTKFSWSENAALLPAVVVPEHADMLAVGDGSVVDCANENVTFGPGGTQEECLLASAPELCVVALLAPTLLPHEALVVKGARPVALFRGRGRDVRFAQALPRSPTCSRVVLCVDALEIDAMTTTRWPIEELRESSLRRELTKLLAAFHPSPDGTPIPRIHTCHWGCGVFAGNKQLKALIQAMVAGAAGHTDMAFHDFVDSYEADDGPSPFVKRLMRVVESLRRVAGVTVGELYRFWLSADMQTLGQTNGDADVWETVLSRFAK